MSTFWGIRRPCRRICDRIVTGNTAAAGIATLLPTTAIATVLPTTAAIP